MNMPSRRQTCCFFFSSFFLRSSSFFCSSFLISSSFSGDNSFLGRCVFSSRVEHICSQSGQCLFLIRSTRSTRFLVSVSIHVFISPNGMYRNWVKWAKATQSNCQWTSIRIKRLQSVANNIPNEALFRRSIPCRPSTRWELWGRSFRNRKSLQLCVDLSRDLSLASHSENIESNKSMFGSHSCGNGTVKE